jgi:hypothetical protein
MEHTVSQLVDEYRKFQGTGRLPPANTFRFPDGNIVELCSSNTDDWTICLIRQPDNAITPLLFGERDEVFARYMSFLAGWDPALWPPPCAVVDGATRVFTPAGMSHLLGVIEVGHAAVLLGVLKRATKRSSALALVHVHGPRVTVLHVGEPMDLRRIDVDHLLGLQAARLEVQTREAAATLLPAFARLLARSSMPSKRAGPRHRGKGSVHLFIWVLVQLTRMGAEDLYGRLGDIEKQIKAYLPGVDLPREVLGDVLALMLDVRTCLVVRSKLMWHIRLSGLNDLESAIHKKFCAEAPTTLVDLDATARVCAPEVAPMRTKLQRRPRSPVVPIANPDDGTATAATAVPVVTADVPPAAVLPADVPLAADPVAPSDHAERPRDVPIADFVEHPRTAPDDRTDAATRARAEVDSERQQRLNAELHAIALGLKLDALKRDLAEARQTAAQTEAQRPAPPELARMAEAERELAAIRRAKADDIARLCELVESGNIPEAFSFLIARTLGVSLEECDKALEHIAQLRVSASAEHPPTSPPGAHNEQDVPT